MGYHRAKIHKGTYGMISKIQEEVEELQDAHDQGSKILELCELADLYGAIEGYLGAAHPHVSMDDLKHMSNLTKSAFHEGERKSSSSTVSHEHNLVQSSDLADIASSIAWAEYKAGNINKDTLPWRRFQSLYNRLSLHEQAMVARFSPFDNRISLKDYL